MTCKQDFAFIEFGAIDAIDSSQTESMMKNELEKFQVQSHCELFKDNADINIITEASRESP